MVAPLYKERKGGHQRHWLVLVSPEVNTDLLPHAGHVRLLTLINIYYGQLAPASLSL